MSDYERGWQEAMARAVAEATEYLVTLSAEPPIRPSREGLAVLIERIKSLRPDSPGANESLAERDERFYNDGGRHIALAVAKALDTKNTGFAVTQYEDEFTCDPMERLWDAIDRDRAERDKHVARGCLNRLYELHGRYGESFSKKYEAYEDAMREIRERFGL